MTKILIVNPNTTASMTLTIGAAARAVAAKDTEISAVTSSMGPASIEGFYDEAFAVPGLIQALMAVHRKSVQRHFHRRWESAVRPSSSASSRTIGRSA